jgi:hypothetical protein
MWKKGTTIVMAAIVCCNSAIHSQPSWRNTNLDWKVHKIGNVYRAVLNSSYRFNRFAEVTQPLDYRFFKYTGPNAIYPRGSNIENADWSRKPSIGAIMRRDARADTLYIGEFAPGFFPHAEPWDTVWAVNGHSVVEIPYWPSYQGISDEDFVCRYSSDLVVPQVYETVRGIRHVQYDPLNIDIIEQSLTWSFPPLNDLVVYIFHVIPMRYDLERVFVGVEDLTRNMPYSPDVAFAIADSLSRALFFPDDHLVMYLSEQLRGYPRVQNHVGYKLFAPPSSSPLMWTMDDDWWHFLSDLSFPENEFVAKGYQILSSGIIFPPGQEHHEVSRISFGPIDVPLGDTLSFVVAEIYSQSLRDALYKSHILDKLFKQNFQSPRPPPSPHVRVVAEDKKVTLQWDPQPGDINPETYQDPFRGDSMAVPFEGYRVYKSTTSANGPWTLLAEYDIPGNGFGNEIGIRHEYVDLPVLSNFSYYFSVTAFSKSDTVLHFPSSESPIAQSVVRVAPSRPPARGTGEVAVVPNPYRGDMMYYSYRPSWEQPTGKWDTWIENDRRVSFINLPQQCEIKVYTLAGDVIQTLRHDDPNNSFHDWNLTSYNYQAVSSGIYLFTVRDTRTGEIHVGKFVVVR